MAAKKPNPSKELQDDKTPFERVKKLLRQLPDEVPAEVAAQAALDLRDGENWWAFTRLAAGLPERVIRVMLERLRSERDSLLSIFLVSAMQDSKSLERDWARGIQALLDLNTTYGWGSKQRKAKIKQLATGPLLSSIQAAVAVGKEPTIDMLAVLAADGTETSVDALLPHFHAAAREKSDVLDDLESLKTHAAKTKEMKVMFESVEQLLGSRNEESPALAFARRLGFEVNTFSAHWSLWSVETNSPSGGVPVYQCHVQIDSKSACWFRVNVSHVPNIIAAHRSTSFGDGGDPHTVDQLKLGRCTPDELPAWFAKVGKKLKVHWTVSIWNASLRGAKRDRLLAWMRPSTGSG